MDRSDSTETRDATDRAVDAVLAWFDTDEARARASAMAGRWGLSGVDALAENVLHEARLRMWHRRQSPQLLQLDDAPAAYGTAVLKSVVARLVSGRDAGEDLPLHLTADEETSESSTSGAETGVDLDALRVAVEVVPAKELWVTAAALGWVTVTMFPDEIPSDAPSPRAGSPPHQARCWPALWFAGERTIFGSGGGAGDDARVRKARSRRIEAVLDHIERAREMYEFEMGRPRD
jgi:hypothetical protein